MCGIAGIINRSSRCFDFSSFCVLGIANDSRGGDSCGIFIDGQYDYGVAQEKYFSDFFQRNELLGSIEHSQVALLHCRKASVGAVSRDTAQPVIIKNEFDKTEFALIHNGTIYNYEELANKYIPNIDIRGMTDSQVMARIFYYSGYEVLKEYIGGSVFVIADYRTGSPNVLLFKGASPKYATTKELEEERPLWFCLDQADGEFMFSSIGVHLMALRPYLDVYSLTPNTLFRYNKGKLEKLKYYDRSTSSQHKSTIYTVKPYVGHEVQTVGSPYIYSNWIVFNPENITYTLKGQPCHGLKIVSNSGKIEDKITNDSNEAYFWNGVLLKNRNSFRFLNVCKRKSKLNDGQFLDKFEHIIWFLSMHELKFNNQRLCYKINSLDETELYTGELYPLFGSSCYTFNSGKKAPQISYTGSHSNTCKILKKEYPIDFRELNKLCRQLMKEQRKS